MIGPAGGPETGQACGLNPAALAPLPSPRSFALRIEIGSRRRPGTCWTAVPTQS